MAYRPKMGLGMESPVLGMGWGWNRPFGVPIGGSTGLSGEVDFTPIMASELETTVTVEEPHIILLLTDEVPSLARRGLFRGK